MRLLAFVLAVMATFTSFGINHADSVNVIFRTGHRQFDPSLGENRLMMDSFIAKVREAADNGDIERIVVRAYASPDGTSKANELLARHRCDAISDYIIQQSGVNANLIQRIPEGIAWDGLKQLVIQNTETPSRNAILDILDNTPVWVYDSHGKVIDGRKSRLMSLGRGLPYRWMEKNLFPQLRNALAVTMVTKQPTPPEAETLPSDPASEILQITEDPGNKAMEDYSDISEKPDTISRHVEPEYIYSVKHRFALKTNLLYDAILFPNLELEWLFNKNWSVALEGDVAWWKPDFTHVYRLAIISPEARYHIRPRAPWHGMYVGLFVGGGLYQLENGGNGYHGEGGMGGVSFGYMWPIGKHFSLEAGIGAGYMSTRYKIYENRDNHKLYMRTKTLNYFGPLKLKFSIPWRFAIMTKNVKVNSTL